VYFFVGEEGPKSIAKLEGGTAEFSPWILHCALNTTSSQIIAKTYFTQTLKLRKISTCAKPITFNDRIYLIYFNNLRNFSLDELQYTEFQNKSLNSMTQCQVSWVSIGSVNPWEPHCPVLSCISYSFPS